MGWRPGLTPGKNQRPGGVALNAEIACEGKVELAVFAIADERPVTRWIGLRRAEVKTAISPS